MTLKIRVKSNFDLTKIVKNEKNRITKKVIKEAQKKAPEPLIKSIVDTIQRGNSPVQGNQRFEGYSEMYKAMMKAGKLGDKKPRPVNLTLTGRMIESLTFKKLKNGFSLIFKDKKATWHNKGVGRLPIRKLFPTKSEKWKPSVVKPLKKILESILSKTVKRRK